MKVSMNNWTNKALTREAVRISFGSLLLCSPKINLVCKIWEGIIPSYLEENCSGNIYCLFFSLFYMGFISVSFGVVEWFLKVSTSVRLMLFSVSQLKSGGFRYSRIIGQQDQ